MINSSIMFESALVITNNFIHNGVQSFERDVSQLRASAF
jgi:hypothetical protein